MEGWNEGEEEKDGEEEKRGYANGEMRKKEGNEGEVKPHAIRILDNTTFLCVVLPLHGCATGCLISLFVSNIMHTQTHTHTHTHTSNCTGCVLPLSLSDVSPSASPPSPARPDCRGGPRSGLCRPSSE
jgi:hypothetical protein